MYPLVKVVLSIDGDPDPVLNPDPDAVVFRKYHKMQSLVNEYCDGKATMTIHSSPVFRQRFISDEYMLFWREWATSGKNLALHIEDDLYRLSSAETLQPSIFHHPETIFDVISTTLERLKQWNIDCSCFRGGSNGHAPALADFLAKQGIIADLSCAPGLNWPERGVDWQGAPATAYFPLNDNLSARDGYSQKALLMIPLGWDGITPEDRRRPTVNYLANETSTLEHLKRVWDCLVRRATDLGQPQVVSFLCHTYSVENQDLNQQLKKMLTYISHHDGQFISITEAMKEARQPYPGEHGHA
ncbi:hypothetical protein [Sodalis sp. dw_96]|uniref:hypothetical protein n=1 Tax=Sodalis sp. dw_96 TaxID=2719794 RepID=UPI001BD41EA2|nr:hypothetical protein [Sodalis sp. dw_96]